MAQQDPAIRFGGPLATDSDHELVHRIRNGDPAAFHGLVEQYGQYLYGLAAHLLGHGPDAEDARLLVGRRADVSALDHCQGTILADRSLTVPPRLADRSLAVPPRCLCRSVAWPGTERRLGDGHLAPGMGALGRSCGRLARVLRLFRGVLGRLAPSCATVILSITPCPTITYLPFCCRRLRCGPGILNICRSRFNSGRLGVVRRQLPRGPCALAAHRRRSSIEHGA